jgi:O-antigen/teichoic acid export membrane protein
VFSQLDVLFVSSFGGLVAAATYGAAKVFVRIFDLFNQVVQVFSIPFSSRRWEAGDREALVTVAEKLIAFSSLLLLPVGVIMAAVPAELLWVLYGEKYLDGAMVVRALSILALVIPWNAVASSYFIGTGKVKAGFWASVLLVGLALPLYWILTPLFGPAGTATAYAFSQAVVTVVVVLILRRSVPISMLRVLGRWRDIRQLLRDWTTRLLQSPPGEG